METSWPIEAGETAGLSLASYRPCPSRPLTPSLSPSPGRINVKNEELEAMVKEAPGPINFTVFLTMFGEKLKGERGSPGPRGALGIGRR
jgi:hypothetical protein